MFSLFSGGYLLPVTEEIIQRLEYEIPGYNRQPLTIKELEVLTAEERVDLIIEPMGVDGISIPPENGRGRMIMVNSRLMPGHRDFVGWHEYFHKYHAELAFYRRGEYFVSKIELQASILAAVAVMPTPMLIEIGHEVGYLDSDVLRKHFEIPLHLAKFRMKVLDGYQNLLRGRRG